jgi:hypothetical protein
MKPNSFRLLVFHKSLEASELQQLAVKSNWQISWVGDTGQFSAISDTGSTGWTDAKHGHVYADIDTKVPFCSSIRVDHTNLSFNPAHMPVSSLLVQLYVNHSALA